jgi:hypothetical protein
MIPTVNSDYFLKQHYRIDLCNGEVLRSIWGTDEILKCYLDKIRFQRVKHISELLFLLIALRI